LFIYIILLLLLLLLYIVYYCPPPPAPHLWMRGVEGEEYRCPPRCCKNAINTQNTYPVEIIDKYPNV
jgi:hypothetical protein